MCLLVRSVEKEAQIVSDYNILEDDYLDSLLQEGEKPSVPSKSKQKEKSSKAQTGKADRKKNRKKACISSFSFFCLWQRSH